MICGGFVWFGFFCLVFVENISFWICLHKCSRDLLFWFLCVISYLNRTAITLHSVGPFGIKRGFTVRGHEASLNEH